MRDRSIASTLALALICLGPGPALAAGKPTPPPAYTLVDLGGDGLGSGAYAISSFGIAAGFGLVQAAQPHAVRFSDRQVEDLGTLGGDASVARSVNRWGECAGWARLPSGDHHAFFTDTRGMHDLGTLGGHTSDAAAISDDGTVVGSSFLSDDRVEVPFVWTPKQGMRLIELPGLSGRALDINRNSEIVGYGLTDVGELHGFLMRGETVTDLGTLGGANSKAYAINDEGVAVGYSLTGGDPPFFHAVAWRSGEIQDLGVLPGGHSVANDINDRGDIVGFSYTVGDTQVATLFHGGQVVDLNTLVAPGSGWILNAAFSVNDAGVIAGVGTYQGLLRAFELDPAVTIPAPVQDPGEPAFAVRVAPSIVSTSASLELSLPRDANVRLDALDVSGRRVGSLDLGVVPAGARALDLANLVPSGAHAGVYFVRLAADGTLRSKTRFVLAR